MAKTSFGLMDNEERKYWKDFGDRVFEARKRANITQEDLGKLVDLTRCSIANVEGGRQRMTAYKKYQIECLLGKLS